jgi:transglutaminase-like putative cysteine protease
MRFLVTHHTRYRYEEPVFLEPHLFRMRPRDDGSQRLLNFDLRIDPKPSESALYLDHEGNVVLHAWFDGLTGHLAVDSRFEVETERLNPFRFLLAGDGMATVPVAYPDGVRETLQPCSRSDQSGRLIYEFAKSVARDVHWQTMAFLSVLNQRIFQRTRHTVRDHGPPQGAEQTLSEGVGACRDVAVLFCEACRCMGLAARFVSGYEQAAANEEHSYMHAWAEVYLPGGGWRSYDPSRGLAVAEQHVPVAAAIHPAGAAPVSGSYRGPGGSAMEFEIHMEVETDPAALLTTP